MNPISCPLRETTLRVQTRNFGGTTPYERESYEAISVHAGEGVGIAAYWVRNIHVNVSTDSTGLLIENSQ